MKKIRKGVALALALLSVYALSACGSTNLELSFVQEGQETVVKTVHIGETLFDVPIPVQAEGYTVTWERSDFTNLQSSLTIKAVFTPNTYIINYEIEQDAEIDEPMQAVRYKDSFELATPTRKGRVFVGWKLAETETFVENGEYAWTENITLTAVWDVDNDNEYTYFH